MNEDDFLRNKLVKDAVLRNVEVIGEAPKQIDTPFVSNTLKSQGEKWQACATNLFTIIWVKIDRRYGRL